MTALTGKHRTVFDVAAHKDGKPLAQSTNYLDAWRDAFQTPERELNLVVGVHGEAIPIVLVDSLWARFQLASQYGIGTALKEVPARNIFLTPSASATTLVRPDQTVAALQARGVKILICMNSIEGAAAKLSAAGFGASAQVRGALLDGIVPGVILVPAMVVALTQLQARGLSYIKIS
jgi:intracellular sulfur oxidation DsrE/DsrF family protein